MRTIVLYIALLILLFGATKSYSHQTKESSPRLTFKPKNSAESLPDSIVVAFWRENISENYGRRRLVSFKPINGAINVKLPNIGHIAMFDMVIHYGKEKLRSNKYYAEPADWVTVLTEKINGNILLSFSGKGAAKYNLRDLMEKEHTKLTELEQNDLSREIGVPRSSKGKIESASYYTSEDFTKYLNSIFENTMRSTENNNRLISEYSSEINQDLIDFYREEFNGGQMVFPFFIHHLYTRAKTDECRKIIADFYFSKIGLLSPKQNNPLVKYSMNKVYYKGYRITWEMFFRNNGRNYPMKAHYDTIKKEQNEDLRERLLIDFMINPRFQQYISDPNNKDSCLLDAYNYVRTPSLKAVLEEQRLFSAGAKVYDFSFPDTLGNQVSLKDMKGKVFLIDFYGEGCGACATFAKRFKTEIYPEFAGNRSFEVISVSIDKTRERWLRAMNSGLYTQKYYINLDTGGLGAAHPMLQYYNLNAVPFLLLVDHEGKLIFRINGQSSESIRTMIRKALNNHSSEE